MRDISKYKEILKEDYESFAGPDWPPYTQFIKHENVEAFVYAEIDEFVKNYTKFADPAFCVLPFYGTELPKKIVCCLMKPGNTDEVKKQMLSGIRPDACSVCWHLEDAGLVSDRILKNNTLDYYANCDLSLLYNDAKKNSTTTISYKIDTSSVCNATCVTCSGSFSSAWRRLEKKHTGISNNTFPNITSKQAQGLINFSTAKMINFRGGEPLLSETNFLILRELVNCGNTDCFISFTTNGSIIPNTQQLEILSMFSHVNFNISIDGLGPVFEYLRYPLRWATILKTIDFCKNQNYDISVSYTLSNLNVLYHTKTTEWFKQNSLNYNMNSVSHPTYFRPSALSQTLKSKILSKDSNPEITAFLQHHSTIDETDFEKFKIEIAKQDKWKNIVINDFMPELIELIKQDE